MNNLHFGLNDEPTEHDSIESSKYIEGLGEFIKTCQTPMTIAIQGDWGTGKTSAIKHLKRKLRERGAEVDSMNASGVNQSQEPYWCIDFNTWQYSQFDLGNNLALSLTATILNALQKKVEEVNLDVSDPDGDDGSSLRDRILSVRRKVKKVEPFIGAVAKGVAKTATSIVLPVVDKKTVEDVFAAASSMRESLARDEEEDVSDVGLDASIELITSLRSDLQGVASAICGNEESRQNGIKHPKRIIVFIDDLDRLEPAKAIAVMEAIKVFLDVEHCVFVLAIDFGVVLRGVREKYGDDLEEEKARAFFDKIIQVPFNLPTAAYSISGLLEKGLEAIGADVSNSSIDSFEHLVKDSVGRNPRSIKRLINTFGLVKLIGGQRDQKDNKKPGGAGVVTSDQHIFSILCLQTAFPEVFQDLVRASTSGKLADFWDELVQLANGARSEETGEGHQQSEEKLLSSTTGLSEYRESMFRRFAQQLIELFSTGTSKKGATTVGLNEELLDSALEKAAVTAVGSGDVQELVAGVAGRKSEPMSLEERMTAWRGINRGHAAQCGKAFEEGLKEDDSGVEAGLASAWWSYNGTEGSGFPPNRFLEVHHRGYGLSVLFGKGLSYETVEEIRNAVKRLGLSVSNQKSNPPLAINNIKEPENARAVASIIARAYISDRGQK